MKKIALKHLTKPELIDLINRHDLHGRIKAGATEVYYQSRSKKNADKLKEMDSLMAYNSKKLERLESKLDEQQDIHKKVNLISDALVLRTRAINLHKEFDKVLARDQRLFKECYGD